MLCQGLKKNSNNYQRGGDPSIQVKNIFRFIFLEQEMNLKFESCEEKSFP
jgi:hypothetical protein